MQPGTGPEAVPGAAGGRRRGGDGRARSSLGRGAQIHRHGQKDKQTNKQACKQTNKFFQHANRPTNSSSLAFLLARSLSSLPSPPLPPSLSSLLPACSIPPFLPPKVASFPTRSSRRRERAELSAGGRSGRPLRFHALRKRRETPPFAKTLGSSRYDPGSSTGRARLWAGCVDEAHRGFPLLGGRWRSPARLHPQTLSALSDGRLNDFPAPPRVSTVKLSRAASGQARSRGSPGAGLPASLESRGSESRPGQARGHGRVRLGVTAGSGSESRPGQAQSHGQVRLRVTGGR